MKKLFGSILTVALSLGMALASPVSHAGSKKLSASNAVVAVGAVVMLVGGFMWASAKGKPLVGEAANQISGGMIAMVGGAVVAVGLGTKVSDSFSNDEKMALVEDYRSLVALAKVVSLTGQAPANSNFMLMASQFKAGDALTDDEQSVAFAKAFIAMDKQVRTNGRNAKFISGEANQQLEIMLQGVAHAVYQTQI